MIDKLAYNKLVYVPELKEGMIVAETVFSNDGTVLIDAGSIITRDIINHLLNWNVRFVKIVSDLKKRSIIKKVQGFEYRPVAVELGKKIVREVHSSALKVAEEILSNLQEKKREQINVEKIKKVTVKLVDEAMQNKEIFVAMINIKKYKNYLYTHSLNVSVLSILIGITMGFKREELLEIGEGALLHDVGMCVIPRDIWDSDKILDENQFFHIKKHPIFGNDILQTSRITNPKIINIVYQHHERIDGSGYPQGLKGDKINLYAKIVAVCDVFDAMNSERKFRGRYLPYDIMSHLIRNAHLIFDPDVMKSFVRFVSLFPLSSFVKLNTGETCLVVGSNEVSPIRPVVKVLLDENNKRVKKGRIINLLESDEYYIVQPVVPDERLVDAFEDY
ncbi:MAG: HD-GYP domain-containing protein [Candidatus Hydrogenedentota bacterium]